jgi:hypothetical protein
MPFKFTAVLLSLILMISGPLVPLAHAQQSSPEEDAGTVAAMVASNIFYVPGKVIVCTLGIGFGVAATVITFGTIYRDTVGFMAKACGGKWVVETRDVQPVLSEASPR